MNIKKVFMFSEQAKYTVFNILYLIKSVALPLIKSLSQVIYQYLDYTKAT